MKSQVCDLSRRRRGFTLVELLVVITIIALLAAFVLGALAKTREVARADATKATIAKLNDLVMRKYESYMTRRLPISMPPMSLAFGRAQVSLVRMQTIRDLMRMEMPERWCDITTKPGFTTGTAVGPTGKWDSGVSVAPGQTISALPIPALQRIYLDKYNNYAKYGMKQPVKDHQQAKCLYLWVMTAIPEAKTMFSGSEIADADGDGWKMFVDGWGNPIGFLRWAPGATVTLTAPVPPPPPSPVPPPSPIPVPPVPTWMGAGIGWWIPGTGWSDVQIDDTLGANLHHDPFDPNIVENTPATSSTYPDAAYHLYPLIFAGVLGKVNGFDDYGIVLGNKSVTGDARDATVTAPTVDPFAAPYAGAPGKPAVPPIGSVMVANGSLPAGGVPLVHNQHMEQK